MFGPGARMAPSSPAPPRASRSLLIRASCTFELIGPVSGCSALICASGGALSGLGLKQDLVYKVARRWISGRNSEEAVASARQVNGLGLGAILNYLGEDVTDPSVAERHADEYLKLQRAISSNNLDGCVSIKLTQFGLLADERLSGRLARKVADQAASLG